MTCPDARQIATYPDLMEGYVRDQDLRLYRKIGFEGIGYSDGSEQEERILSLVRDARDIGIFSKELTEAISDWPSEYHLSCQRHCILRPLGIKPGERVLEVGCGAGALTRFIGELGAHVTAVEGSPRRARVAAERCRDLPSVRVLIDDLSSLQIDGLFDWILLVGVLEYAPVFSTRPEPYSHYLESLKPYLARGGRLVIAIENKLGLKYFNGCSEDHTGIPYFGVQGLYDEGTPRTFGRQELIELLGSVGFTEIDFMYPFPDYKLPRVILTQEGLEDAEFRPADLLWRNYSRDYGGHSSRLFDEPLALREISRNGLLGELSNSFLLKACKENRESVEPKEKLLAVTYSVCRLPNFATQTSFVRSEPGIRVIKEHLFPKLSHKSDSRITFENIARSNEYFHGTVSAWRVTAARAAGGDIDQIVQALSPWFSLIVAKSRCVLGEGEAKSLSDLEIDGCFVDLTPFNVLDTKAGMVPIDQEWQVSGTIPLGWLVVRSLVSLLADCPGFEKAEIDVGDVTRRLCEGAGLDVSNDTLEEWQRFEGMLQAGINGDKLELTPNRSLPKSDRRMPLSALALARGAEIERLQEEVDQLQNKLRIERRRLEAKVRSTESSRSWRVTRPMRAVAWVARSLGKSVVK